MSEFDYDYFVIGAGSGGVRSARIAAGHGAKVGIAEYQEFGGTCVNVGCVPKKLMSYAAEYGEHFEDAEGFGWNIATPDMDWSKLIARKNAEILRLNGIYESLLGNAGVDIHLGYAKFIDAHTLDVAGKRITAQRILIATGGKPRRPDYAGGEFTVTSDEFFFMETQPKRAIVQGGGYIAVEFAHILSGMGTEVHLVYRGERFLKNFDHDLSEALAEEMQKQGIIFHFSTDIEAIEKSGNKFNVQINTGDDLEVDAVVVALGRDANTAGLEMGNAGIEANANGTISVNDRYETNVPHIYALGDIANEHNLTPVALAEGHVLADRLFAGMEDRAVCYENIATAIFSKPTIATIGLSEQQARAQGIEIAVYKSKFKPLVHTLSGRDEKTMMKLIVEKSTDKVIGCHMMGLYAAEIMQGFAVAMNAGATKAVFDKTIGIHPTAAEEFVTMRSAAE